MSFLQKSETESSKASNTAIITIIKRLEYMIGDNPTSIRVPFCDPIMRRMWWNGSGVSV